MRLNRKIRIGAAIVALCLLLLGLGTIARKLQQPAETPQVANATGTVAGPTATPASANRIAVAREDIPERSIVTPEMLTFREAPPGFNTAAFVTNSEAQAIGFITSRPITAGTQVRQADFLGHISDVGIAGALLPGRRAMIIPIANKATLHELVRIGDRVDIMASFEQQEARVVAEDVRVLAVDVFGNDYPQIKIAMRGDYKAPARSFSSASPPSPPGQGTGGAGGTTNTASNPDAPAGQPAQPGSTGPEATPTPGPPPGRPESALTIEVSPQQATDIALTQAAGQNLDFLLRARSEPRTLGGATGTPGEGGVTLAGGVPRSAAFSIRERISPYATRLKRASAAPARSANTSANARSNNAGTGRRVRDLNPDSRPLPLPTFPAPVRDLPPFNPNGGPGPQSTPQPQPPATYEIPIYGDGKLVRTDTVRRPRQ